MSFHIFSESSITPTTQVVNIRSVMIDTPNHPHRIGFSVQTTIADLTAGVVTARVRYEDETHSEHVYELPPITLTSTDPLGGGFQSHDVFDSFDKFYQDLTGAFGEPYGLLQLELDLGGLAGDAKITYSLMLEKIDGTDTIYTYP